MDDTIHYFKSYKDPKIFVGPTVEYFFGEPTVETRTDTLRDAQENLHLASEGLQRIINRGDIPLSKKQNTKAVGYYSMNDRIKKMIRFKEKNAENNNFIMGGCDRD